MSGMWLALAALNGLLAVAAGAYAAHGLEAEAANWMDTGSRYQMWHALAILLALSLRRDDRPERLTTVAIVAYLFGILLFSCTLYAMALGFRGLSSLAPVGGLSFMVGWASLGLYGLRRSKA